MLSVGSYLVHGTPHPEDGEVPVVFTYFAQFEFGDRCFRHFIGYEAEADADALVEKIRADGRVTASHVETSPHWAPHPYCDGSLLERLALEGEEEERARFEERSGGFLTGRFA